jgi:hypothetical protein
VSLADLSRTQAISSADVLEAAAYALVAERCRPSYLHDIRGGLQALNSAVELLARTAKNPGEDAALVQKAVALARRAMLNHEQALFRLVDQVAPHREIAGTVNVGDMMSDVVRFIRTDAAGNSITFRLTAAPDVLVCAQAGKFRLLVLGLCCTLADGLGPGSVVDVTVDGAEGHALIEFRPIIPSRPAAGGNVSPYELLLDLTRQWVGANGGRLELSAGADSPCFLRIHYPSEARLHTSK